MDKEKVLALQAIVADAGAHRGFLLSESGFQSGAITSARTSNITLTTSRYPRERRGGCARHPVERPLRAPGCGKAEDRPAHRCYEARQPLGHDGAQARPPGEEFFGNLGRLSFLERGLGRARMGQFPIAYGPESREKALLSRRTSRPSSTGRLRASRKLKLGPRFRSRSPGQTAQTPHRARRCPTIRWSSWTRTATPGAPRGPPGLSSDRVGQPVHEAQGRESFVSGSARAVVAVRVQGPGCAGGGGSTPAVLESCASRTYRVLPRRLRRLRRRRTCRSALAATDRSSRVERLLRSTRAAARPTFLLVAILITSFMSRALSP